MFGLEPSGYHLVHASVLTAMTLASYWLVRELRASRWVAIAVSALWGLSPLYATNRYWFAAFGYVLSMALCLASLAAEARAVRARGRTFAGWKLAALMLLVAAGLGYEVVLPFLVLGPLVIWWRAGGRQVHPARRLAPALPNMMLLTAVFATRPWSPKGSGPPGRPSVSPGSWPVAPA
jgi:hypothetical protein